LRCLVCKEGDPLNKGKWIEKKSLAGHFEGAQHKAQVAQKQEGDQRAAERSQQLRETHSGPSTSPIQTSTDPTPTYHAEMDHGRSPSPTWQEYEAAGLNAPVIPSFIPLTAHDRALEQERLRKQVEQLLTQSEESDDDEDLDATINTFRDLGALLHQFPLTVCSFSGIKRFGDRRRR
jgi:hypothetical protein